MSADRALVHERRVLRLATFYAQLAAGGAWPALRHGVAAHAEGDPARNLALRGTGPAPPLFLPAVLLAAAVLARRRNRVGIAATVEAGLVGLAFTAGSTLNLPADLAAARDARSPVGLTAGLAALV